MHLPSLVSLPDCLLPSFSCPLPPTHFVLSGTTPPSVSLSLIISDSPPAFAFFFPSHVFVCWVVPMWIYSICPCLLCVCLTLIILKRLVTEVKYNQNKNTVLMSPRWLRQYHVSHYNCCEITKSLSMLPWVMNWFPEIPIVHLEWPTLTQLWSWLGVSM